MRKTIFVLIAGTLLTTGLLSTACKGTVTINGDKGSDTIEFNTDSIQEININVQTNNQNK